MGGFRQDSSFFFPCFLTNGNILILAFISQDWKYNFVITSLLEPCLIISNYAVRYAAWACLCSSRPAALCVFTLISSTSMFLHLSRLQCQDQCCCINNTVRYCPRGSLLCVSVVPAFFIQFVTQFTQTWSMACLRICIWCSGISHAFWKRKTHPCKTCENVCIIAFISA